MDSSKLTDIILLKNLLNERERPPQDYTGLIQPFLLILIIYYLMEVNPRNKRYESLYYERPYISYIRGYNPIEEIYNFELPFKQVGY